MIHEAAKGSIQGAEAKTTSSSTEVEIQQPCTGAKKAKAKAQIVKGKTKKNAGKATGNKRLKAKGKAGELGGKLKLKSEKAKTAAKK